MDDRQTAEAPLEAQAEKFDQVIAKEADALVFDLVSRHPELRGAAIVFDWDLPRNAANAFPAGAWRVRDGSITPDKCFAMQLQLARFMNHMSKTIERMMSEVLNNYRALQSAMTTPKQPAESTGQVTLRSHLPARPAGPVQGMPLLPIEQPLAPPQSAEEQALNRIPLPAPQQPPMQRVPQPPPLVYAPVPRVSDMAPNKPQQPPLQAFVPPPVRPVMPQPPMGFPPPTAPLVFMGGDSPVRIPPPEYRPAEQEG